ncbi:disease resistance-like protein DSC1 [Neltuma alba]|uniref:disease resistance-like protein DSC1 n=1 Tax=Neltuma alba TaxID=207710 RepID=UPI0010A3DA34|nr:disease resistance-like protein DSC1 [Prosopis alba]
MSIGVTSYLRGLPLAVKLIGSTLRNGNLTERRYTLQQYNQITGRKIHEILKISYDCLQDGAKRIFLDIACFFKEKNLEYVEDILGACYYGTRFYIEVLVDKSLITVADNGRLHMHDLIQQMAREIVEQEAPSNLRERSRLWYYKDVLNGGNDIEGIILDPPKQEEVMWNGLAFEKMNNLRILIVRNTQLLTSPKYLPNSLRLLDWRGYPSMTLPLDFSPPKLVCFKVYGSLFKMEEAFQKFECVTYMNFSKCELLREVPDMSHVQNLKTLSFRECRNLIKVHDSAGSLRKLILLDVGECTKLKSFPCEINMPSLEDLILSDCKSLNYFPHIVRKMDALNSIFADGTAIKELPPSIGNLSRLGTLFISSCKSLRELPNSLLMLQNLSTLALGGIQPRGGRN